MKLIIVESPTKSRTLESFLSKEYKVLSSFGHIRDLPKGKLGIDTEKDFKPTYVIPTKARKTVTSLKNAAKKAKKVILATDEDREGEAIAWHLSEILELKEPERIVFHEITKTAIQEALKNPRKIDGDRVNAQQARRILDRLVGYKLSPFLWKKVSRGLSAGRVQSVAVRILADREQEIKAFTAQEYWSIEVDLKKEKKVFRAVLQKKAEKVIEKLAIQDKEAAAAIVKDLKGAEYKVAEVERKEVKRNPLPPFTTSTLQQTAGQRLHFPAKLTMQLAQQLYEQGLITYHRTDSLTLSQLSLDAAKAFIQKTYGTKYWPGTARRFKTKSRGAQEAHEAIRPAFAKASADKPTFATPESSGLVGPKLKLYELIWKRFIASQMSPALVDATTIDIETQSYMFRATGQMLQFDGFLGVYEITFEETNLPTMQKGDVLSLKELLALQHFTQPPARYTEASLIKILEEHGIGRPSTYAPTLTTIQERGYVEKDEKRRLFPTELGTTVNNLLVQHFPDIVDITFTANMEESLDAIAEGKKDWVPMLQEFYGPFDANLQKKYEEVQKKDLVEIVEGKNCPECKSPVVIRFGRYGKFYACSTFPECRYTEPLEKNKPKTLGITCPKCSPRFARLDSESERAGEAGKKGELVAKRTRRGKIFYACNQYPDCDYALWYKPTGETCKECGALMMQRTKDAIKCSNKDCKSLPSSSAVGLGLQKKKKSV